MFDLDAEYPNSIFPVGSRKPAYFAAEYQALKIVTSVHKTLKDSAFPSYAFAIESDVDIGLEFAKTLDHMRHTHGLNFKESHWLALIPSDKFDMFSHWMTRREMTSMIGEPITNLRQDNKSIFEFFGFPGILMNVMLFTDYYIHDNYKFVQQPTIVYSDLIDPWWGHYRTFIERK